MRESLAGPVLKVERAKKHARELAGFLDGFAAGNPYEAMREDDPQTGEIVYRVRIRAPLPSEISVIVGDLIHNCRAALDLLMGQLVKSHTGAIGKDTFPIVGSKSGFETGTLRTLKGRVAPDALDLIRKLKPYPGGNDVLWRLHRLDIIDKHRLLLFVTAALNTMILTFSHPSDPERTLRSEYNMEPLWPLKDRDELTRTKRVGFAGFEDIAEVPVPEAQFSFVISLHEPEVIDEPEPILQTLNGLLGSTQGVINDFSAVLP